MRRGTVRVRVRSREKRAVPIESRPKRSKRCVECLWFRGLFSVRQDDQPLSGFNMMTGQDEKVKSEWTGGPVEAGSRIGVEQWLL